MSVIVLCTSKYSNDYEKELTDLVHYMNVTKNFYNSPYFMHINFQYNPNFNAFFEQQKNLHPTLLFDLDTHDNSHSNKNNNKSMVLDEEDLHTFNLEIAKNATKFVERRKSLSQVEEKVKIDKWFGQ